eukprot:GHVT01081821.1.p1 GENE.GHVT01081821.1~~GHVT01081821.1.p1  ORF type:complete len:405 (-),score=63.35 GHVT01081821.1:255-1469(-)
MKDRVFKRGASALLLLTVLSICCGNDDPWLGWSLLPLPVVARTFIAISQNSRSCDRDSGTTKVSNDDDDEELGVPTSLRRKPSKKTLTAKGDIIATAYPSLETADNLTFYSSSKDDGLSRTSAGQETSVDTLQQTKWESSSYVNSNSKCDTPMEEDERSAHQDILALQQAAHTTNWKPSKTKIGRQSISSGEKKKMANKKNGKRPGLKSTAGGRRSASSTLIKEAADAKKKANQYAHLLKRVLDQEAKDRKKAKKRKTKIAAILAGAGLATTAIIAGTIMFFVFKEKAKGPAEESDGEPPALDQGKDGMKNSPEKPPSNSQTHPQKGRDSGEQDLNSHRRPSPERPPRPRRWQRRNSTHVHGHSSAQYPRQTLVPPLVMNQPAVYYYPPTPPPRKKLLSINLNV